jgi:PAS domain S-box-containing protein
LSNQKPKQALRDRRLGDPYLKKLLDELAAARTERDEVKSRTAAMLNSLGEGLIATDDQGKITMVNDYALDALGYTHDSLIGTWFPKTVIATDQYSRPLPTLVRPIIKALTTGQTISEYAYYLKRDGTLMPVLITVSPVIVNDVPSGAIEVFRDLTKEHQLDVAKEEFVSLASHQLRTPATGVKSILSMLSAGDFGPLSDMQKKFIDKAMHTNNRQLQLIEDLLNVALVDSGKLELDLDYADLAGVVREIASDHADAINNRQQKLSVNLPDTALILVDVAKITMVLDNLISNASKYTPAGGKIDVTLKNYKDMLTVAVQDQGVGIQAEDIPRIFTKFTRLPNELSTTVGGTGLGLFLAKNIVELHGGSIAVTSKPNEGSTFTIKLPTKWGGKV